MSVILTQLETILTCEVELHLQLLDAAEAKREAIIKGDLTSLENLLQHEQHLIGRVENEEARRLALVKEARRELELGTGPVKMKDIIAKAPSPWNRNLSHVRERLREVLDKLRFRTRQNAELLHASIEHANAFMRMVQEAAGGDSTYGRDGKRRLGTFRLLNKSA